MFYHAIGNKISVNKFDRNASRAIIIKNDHILILKSDNDEVKLPGGGLDKGETFIEALIREVREETGYEIHKFYEFGIIDTFTKRKENQDKIFSMRSKYFLVEVNDVPSITNFQGYEIDEHFQTAWMKLDELIRINEIAVRNNKNNNIAERELVAFKEIKKYQTSIIIT